MELDSALMVASLVAKLKCVRGRKHLQKIVHLLKSNGNPEFQQNFILHYFGPYSRQLAAQLDFVCAARLVVEEKDDDGMYTYRPSQLGPTDGVGKRLVADLETDRPWVEFAKTLNKKETPFLEALSTLVFLYSAGLRQPALKREFDRVKPGLKGHYARARRYALDNVLMS